MMSHTNNLNELDDKVNKILRRMDWAPLKATATIFVSPVLILLGLVHSVVKAYNKEDPVNVNNILKIFLCLMALHVAGKLLPIAAQKARIDDFRDYKNILDLIENAENVVPQRKAAYILTLQKFFQKDIAELQQVAPLRFEDPRLRSLLQNIDAQIIHLMDSYDLNYSNLILVQPRRLQATSLVGKFHEISDKIIDQLIVPVNQANIPTNLHL